ncbi:MAG: hypothetical protein ITD30_06705 [Nitrosospira sp.]|nr:hypothetical protein [Nitrosospira sp.]
MTAEARSSMLVAFEVKFLTVNLTGRAPNDPYQRNYSEISVTGFALLLKVVTGGLRILTGDSWVRL